MLRPEAVREPPRLSTILERWRDECRIANTHWDNLTETERTYRVGLSDKHIRATSRLRVAIVPPYL
ncbi:uncharacterized protein B0I36DRAFT_133144 [Microdochium trichocladiopsis]|uniref:Uncharacterized protein n=1 Tax=Microdochium trichocladiopsis TaxID=1682393 RepID=A0A9P8Y4E6_9PEZI|nr:uncharacterized protein B0I36DRAFT_133144 [Microdochium trichocladiopsis]KAH7029476.1 hypothetical protein B0I36DRAFT_133144 [Microdochium trichocladiopsis]